MKKRTKFKLQATILSAAGVAGAVLWQKKDLVEALLQLQQFPEGWIQIQQHPEVFLTKANEKGKENLFAYLSNGPWRLIDQVADGYFWINGNEEVLLLTQKKFLKEYWTWTASRPIFDAPESAATEADAEADDATAEAPSDVEEGL